MAKKGKRIDDETRAAMIAAYASGTPAAQVAKVFDVAETTVRRIAAAEVDLKAAAELKHAALTESMDKYMEDQMCRAQEFISKALDHLLDEEKLADATLAQIATSMAIVIDKWTAVHRSDDEGQAVGVVIMPAVLPAAGDPDNVVVLGDDTDAE